MSGYQPQGEGAHPTLAGNVLDPNVSADGQKGGRGVGGTSEPTIKDEAAEHIGSRGGQSQTSGQGYDTSNSGQNYGTSSSGQGYGTSSSGQGYGTSSINSGEPSATQQHDQGIDYLKSKTGSGQGSQSAGNSSTYGVHGTGETSTDPGAGSTGSGPQIVDDYGSRSAGETGLGSATGPSSAVVGSGVAVGGAEQANRRQNDNYNSQTNTQSTSTSGNTSGSTYNDSTSGQSGGHNRSLDPVSNTDARTQQPTDSNVRTGGDPADADTVGGQTSQTQSSTGSGLGGTAQGGKQPTEAEAANDGDGKGGPPPSIPTAGGERIGTKHWGESKIVPDNPPRRPSENVSSGDGQSDDLTKKNTASNTGGAHDSTGKESVIDKIKDKLHMTK